MTLEDYFGPRLSQPGYDLFAVFSRFEYAMKRGGFRRTQYPDAAWRTFAGSLPEDFFQSMREADQAKVYFEAPPDHLVATDDGGVDWSGAPHTPNDAASLFQSIKTARNNLFHGDKKHDNNRDTQLMIAALFVLNEAFKKAEASEGFEEFLSAMEFGL
ncbi:hypothetical protein PH5382_03799 [Phaeobacter sp. CECT 5382]|uniref:hypothetical protein n=1 Tax=Phaeobacter sp. CECT 5382 TaxID=1712645 RepID=UPI0006DA5CFC|nr:hypothetical protein [Phaeobacter sp. CECT 5382]CUH89846.1 hypothetical protein PH5382_03799 [Phaeobacter sp. CECT 5382]